MRLRQFAAIVAFSVAIFTTAVVAVPPSANTELMTQQAPKVVVGEGHGSGVVIGKRIVVTAAHVVEGKDEAELEFHGGKKMKARVLWRGDKASFDAALLETEEDIGVRPAVIRCDRPKVGEEVVAVGHPMRGSFIFAYGRVASANQWGSFRDIGVLDLGIAPGNSGGPVFDKQGRVVGIATLLFLFPIGWGDIATFGKAGMVPAYRLCAALHV